MTMKNCPPDSFEINSYYEYNNKKQIPREKNRPNVTVPTV